MSRNASQAHAYRRVGVETGVDAATPHQLVAMLFDGFADAVAQARAALQRRDIEAKCKAITRAVRIVDEGLKASLDVRAGGKLGEDLLALYGYIALRLTHANLHNDDAALDECQSLLQPVRSAWAAIGPTAAPSAHAQ
ncbi:MAG TPA: flagellar export chaperone FliS [Caldimonas sp.]|nr:flagellar export chaperone FliS [Caldimonas sp.]